MNTHNIPKLNKASPVVKINPIYAKSFMNTSNVSKTTSSTTLQKLPISPLMIKKASLITYTTMPCSIYTDRYFRRLQVITMKS